MYILVLPSSCQALHVDGRIMKSSDRPVGPNPQATAKQKTRKFWTRHPVVQEERRYKDFFIVYSLLCTHLNIISSSIKTFNFNLAGILRINSTYTYRLLRFFINLHVASMHFHCK